MNHVLCDKNKEIASSCMVDTVVNETHMEIFEISDDLFNYMTPLCVRYEQEVNSYERDGSFWNDSDTEDPTFKTRDMRGGPINVAARLHYCTPMTTMINGSKLTFLSVWFP